MVLPAAAEPVQVEAIGSVGDGGHCGWAAYSGEALSGGRLRLAVRLLQAKKRTPHACAAAGNCKGCG
jgi:hypothetical protein